MQPQKKSPLCSGMAANCGMAATLEEFVVVKNHFL
jgi:hypothetical protein